MNKSPIVLILMVSLVVIMGCAKSDWIQQTLVTVDVTGTWQRVDGGTPIKLDLAQTGAKVTGTIDMPTAGNSRSSVSLSGTVAGDGLNFGVTGHNVKGEATVSGDEMKLRLLGRTYLLAGGDSRSPITLQHTNSSPPRSQ